jgi:arylsulfatase A-like enzyme
MLCACLALVNAKKNPNIIVILTDDLSYSDVGYNGGDLPTPNIDNLAATGIRLNYNYVEMVCSATRSSLLSGRYSFRTGLDDGIALVNKDAVDKDIKFISNSLSDNDYDTLFVGKWHLGAAQLAELPHKRGFADTLYFRNGQIDYYKHNLCYAWGGMVRTGIISGELYPPPISFTIPTLNAVSPNGVCG